MVRYQIINFALKIYAKSINQCAIDYVIEREDLGAGIILYGRSLGGAVSIDLAVRPENEDSIRAVIIENSFTSIPLIGCHLFSLFAPIINILPNFAIKNNFCSIFKGLIFNQDVDFFIECFSSFVITTRTVHFGHR